MDSLPSLRQELTLYPAPHADNGAPTWSLHDPVRNLFFRIDWLTFEILSRWDLNDPQAILDDIAKETSIQPEDEDIDAVLRFVHENELTQRNNPNGSQWYREQQQKRKSDFGQWLLHHYLFFRVPLLRADRWLTKTQALVSPFFTRTFLLLTLASLGFSSFEVSRQWDGFVSTLLDTFSWEGLLGYSAALIFAKFLHELGHAYTAKRFGCRVPTMGVAFVVLFPMAYTDVNDVWKLPSRKQRMAVGAAGILTELTIAIWATLAWTMLPDGYLRGAAFLLSTTTWISTVLINASPFMRFDGYFLLMDWLDMPNLHQRSFALARWQMREWLFGVREPAPENFSPSRHRGLLIFAYLIWVYRLTVFFGIAIMVYLAFPKPLGPLLAAIEIGWFIFFPIWAELLEWKRRIPQMNQSARFWTFVGSILLMVAVVTIPWDRRVRSQGLLKPVEYFYVVAPGPSFIKSLAVNNGESVKKGQVLLQLESPDLGYQQKLAFSRSEGLDWKAGAAGVNQKLLAQQNITAASRVKVHAEIKGLHDEEDRYASKAPFDGTLYFIHPDFQAGTWLAKNERIAVVANTEHWTVETYLSEAELSRMSVGDNAHFYPEAGDGYRPLRIDRIDKDATRVLPEGILASTRGGELHVREANQQLVPETALYRVTLSLTSAYVPERPQILRGRVILFGQPKAYAEEFMHSAAGLFVREAGF